MSALILAQEQIHKTVWYPTVLGILVVAAGVALFCGSIYLLLGTNLGARLGFLVAFSGLMAFMVILTSLWITTASPLNTLKGSIPAWRVKEVVNNLSDSKVPQARRITKAGKKVAAVEAANVKAAADEKLVTKKPTAILKVTPEDNKFARFDLVTDYLATATYEVGGSKPSFLKFQFTHKPQLAVVQFCAAKQVSVPFGLPPPKPQCDPSASKNGYVVLTRNLGSLRLPPLIAFVMSVILFGLGLLALHWRERDEADIARRASGPSPVPAKA